MGTVDLNADLGEIEGDLALIGVVSSASVACGGHAGDESSMLEAARLAVAGGVSIGAHPSYEDRDGFGRREVDLDPAQVAGSVGRQVGRLSDACAAAGGRIAYVKLHGALYHRANKDEACAVAIAEGLEIFANLALLAPVDSVIARVWRSAGRHTAAEAFCDRGYEPDGTLVERGSPGDVLSPEAALAQGLAIARTGEVQTRGGHVVKVTANSLCVHGDTPSALRIAKAVRNGLEDAGVEIRPFAT
ncbi:MAG: LamB/YcsF family protein [Acidimicrobiales bacterium]